jgi:hypothetical protein
MRKWAALVNLLAAVLLVGLLSCSKKNPTSSTGGGGGGDTTLPSVTITIPSNGSTVSRVVTITAQATDNVGVTKVEFYVDGVKIGESTSSPYTMTWDTYPYSDGTLHNLIAQAYDAANNKGTSATVQVTIQNFLLLWSNTWWVNANSYSWVTSYLLASDSIKGTTNVVTGNDISYFYVFDHQNFIRFKAGQTAYYFYGWTGRTSDNFAFRISASDSIHFVWGNSSLITNKQYYAHLQYKRR